MQPKVWQLLQDREHSRFEISHSVSKVDSEREFKALKEGEFGNTKPDIRGESLGISKETVGSSVQAVRATAAKTTHNIFFMLD